MKVRIITSKIANQFFFISTLAAWHYSSREKDREEWLKRTGKLSIEEENTLAIFTRLMKTKYGFQSPEKYLGEIFYKYKSAVVWEKLKKFTTKEDYTLIRKVFSDLNHRFESAWSQDYSARLKVFRNVLRDKKIANFLDVAAFTFGKTITKKEIMNLIVLFSPQNSDFTAAGSANLMGNFITLELPDIKENTWQLSYSIALIGHEVGHLYFKKRNGKKIIERIIRMLKLKKQYSTLPFNTFSIINEAITSAFVPAGALGQKYFSNTIADILFSNLPRGAAAGQSLCSKKSVSYYSNLEMYFVWKLFPLTYAYLHEKKPIDDFFIKTTGLLLKELVR